MQRTQATTTRTALAPSGTLATFRPATFQNQCDAGCQGQCTGELHDASRRAPCTDRGRLLSEPLKHRVDFCRLDGKVDRALLEIAEARSLIAARRARCLVRPPKASIIVRYRVSDRFPVGDQIQRAQSLFIAVSCTSLIARWCVDCIPSPSPDGAVTPNHLSQLLAPAVVDL